jgi:hypothetical protein
VSLPPKILATAFWPSASSTWSTLTLPSSRPLAAWLVAVGGLQQNAQGTGTSVWMALFTSPSSTPGLLAICCGNLVVELVETSHGISTFVAGMLRNRGGGTGPAELG